MKSHLNFKKSAIYRLLSLAQLCAGLPRIYGSITKIARESGVTLVWHKWTNIEDYIIDSWCP